MLPESVRRDPGRPGGPGTPSPREKKDSVMLTVKARAPPGDKSGMLF